jgi:P22 coat protein - gene protein 5
MSGTVPVNILEQVITYQEANLGYLVNQMCIVRNANTKFIDFEQKVANLGDTVTYDKPPRFVSSDGLIVNWQSSVQRAATLSVNRARNVSYNFTSQQMVFNVENYMEIFGESASKELAARIEIDVGYNFVSNTFRFYGDGVNPISTYNQLAKALVLHRTFGAASNMTKMIIPDYAVPDIVGSGLNQYVPDRNDETAISWQFGRQSDCDFFESNLLPLHTAGTEGQEGNVLTVVSTTITNGAITAITFSGTTDANDPDSIAQYDKFQVQDTSGYQKLRYLTFIGHHPSVAPVQFQATAGATSTSGNEVTVQIYPPLVVGPINSANGDAQNINGPIVAGMQVAVMGSHRAGIIMAGNPLMVAIPKLPDQRPFDTGVSHDPDSGISMRLYWGTVLGQNQQGFVHDAAWGSFLTQEYASAILFQP